MKSYALQQKFTNQLYTKGNPYIKYRPKKANNNPNEN